METPLERATKAVECLIGTNCDSCEAPLPSDAADIVRAVLRAIREPSTTMIASGIVERHDQPALEAWSKATANIYTAMIDGVLNEQPPDRIPASEWMKTPSAR